MNEETKIIQEKVHEAMEKTFRHVVKEADLGIAVDELTMDQLKDALSTRNISFTTKGVDEEENEKISTITVFIDNSTFKAIGIYRLQVIEVEDGLEIVTQVVSDEALQDANEFVNVNGGF